jgi:hypothetical protein
VVRATAKCAVEGMRVSVGETRQHQARQPIVASLGVDVRRDGCDGAARGLDSHPLQRADIDPRLLAPP